MISFSNRHRAEQREIMDDLDFKGTEMKNLLDDLRKVNHWLGGHNITIGGIAKLLEDHPINQRITILDIGCGDGEMLRKCAEYGLKNNLNFELIGIDYNKNILEYAKKKSREHPSIKFQKVDVFLQEELLPNCDIALCTLVLHHFGNKKIVKLLKNILKKTSIGLIVNDLERSRTAFILFKIFSKLFLKTKTAQHDGLISIAKGFKKKELEIISKMIPNQKNSIRWHWAFRYQWIVQK